MKTNVVFNYSLMKTNVRSMKGFDQLDLDLLLGLLDEQARVSRAGIVRRNPKQRKMVKAE